MSYVYEWSLSNDRGTMLVEYCFSTVDKCLKVVEMTLNGKYHRENWMSTEGKESMMKLLVADYNNAVGVS